MRVSSHVRCPGTVQFDQPQLQTHGSTTVRLFTSESSNPKCSHVFRCAFGFEKTVDVFESIICEGVGGVQSVLTLFCGGVAQTCHDDRVVELKCTARDRGSRRRKGGRHLGERTMDMTVDDIVFAHDLSQMRCEMTSSGVGSLRSTCTDQRTVCTTQLSKSTSPLVSCLVSCILLCVFTFHFLLFVMML